MTILDDAIAARETELARIAAMCSDMRAAVVRAMGKKTPGESGHTLLRPAPGNAGIIARAVEVYNASAGDLKAETSGDKVKIPFFVLPASLRSLDIVGAHMCAYNETRISARVLMEYLAGEVTAKRIQPDKLRAARAHPSKITIPFKANHSKHSTQNIPPIPSTTQKFHPHSTQTFHPALPFVLKTSSRCTIQAGGWYTNTTRRYSTRCGIEWKVSKRNVPPRPQSKHSVWGGEPTIIRQPVNQPGGDVRVPGHD